MGVQAEHESTWRLAYSAQSGATLWAPARNMDPTPVPRIHRRPTARHLTDARADHELPPGVSR